MSCDRKAANVWTARFIPVILIGIASYVAYVVVGPACINYLISPPSDQIPQRTGAAIAVLIIFFILLFFTTTAYFRLVYVVTFNPGYVPLGPRHQNKKRRRRPSRSRGERSSTADEKVESPGSSSAASSDTPALDGLKNFYDRDVFVCEGDGRPIWCSYCQNHKPDRAHHCSEIDRCVRKMDHFCPWVGGVVSETSWKFFIQFVCYTFLLCGTVIILFAILLAENVRQGGQINVHFVVALSFGALFGLFTLGMSMSSLQFAVLNITTIENISRKVKVWTLAVYMPDPSAMPNTSRPFRTITYPLTPAPSEPLRTFAILHSRPGDNPFDLGKYGNFKSVMGHDLLDWILPLRYSPLCDHSAQDAEFEFGPALERMKRDAGLIPPQEPPRRRRKSKRRSHRGEGSEKINPTPDTSADASLDSNEVERHDDLLGTTVDITTRTQTRRNEIEEAALDRNGNAL